MIHANCKTSPDGSGYPAVEWEGRGFADGSLGTRSMSEQQVPGS